MRADSLSLGQLWLLRDGAQLRARRTLPAGMPWPVPESRLHELSAHQRECLADYLALDDEVRRQRHRTGVLAGAPHA